MSESCVMLPDELLFEILSRLSVKTLIRFTCVCKQWCSVIRSSSFATKQLATARSNLFKDNFQFFFTTRTVPSMDDDMHRGLASLFSYSSFQLAAEFECCPCHYISFSDPCDGIVCVLVKKDDCEAAFLLWNPSIRELEQLPFPLPPYIPSKPSHQKLGMYAFGFGYDPKSGDYKVFVIFSSTRMINDGDWPAEVYSLREGLWKFLPANSFNESMHQLRYGIQRTSPNGKMCNWINGFDNNSLISFDLADEVFLRTPLHERCVHPDFGPILLQSNQMDAQPRVLCCHHPSYCPGDRCDIEIWVLDEYGALGCWSKQIAIEFQYYETVLGPLGFWQDEEMLMLEHFGRDDNGIIARPLLSYNAGTKQLNVTTFEKTRELMLGCGYIESLVSVKGRCRQLSTREHLQQDESDVTNTLTLREVNVPVSPLNSFRCSSVPWCNL